MGLKTSQVYRCLDKKTLIFGFEIVDLFLVFVLLAFLNFIFGSMPYKFLLSWGPSASLALFIKLMKKGKPDNYLTHLLRSYVEPKIYSCFSLSTSLAKKRTRFLDRRNRGYHEK